MNAKPNRRDEAAWLRYVARRYDGRSKQFRALLTRTKPAVVTIACAANHLVSLGQARDEMERKA